MSSKPIRKAVFPVAGMGTRFLPATKAVPKEMLPIIDRPLIQYAVDEARESGIEQMIFVTGRGKTGIVEHFDIAFELEQTMTERGRDLSVLECTRATPGDVIAVRQQVPMVLGVIVVARVHPLGTSNRCWDAGMPESRQVQHDVGVRYLNAPEPLRSAPG